MEFNRFKFWNKSTSKNGIVKSIFIIICILFIAFATSMFVLKRYVYPLKYFDIVKKEAANNNVDPYLILSIIKIESNFNIMSTSNKNAKGLMQMIEATAKEVNDRINVTDNIDENDIYDVDLNIALGTNYIASLIKRYNGNYYLAICAYNAGLGNVDKWIAEGIISHKLNDYENTSIPFKETENYLKNVMSTYKMYKMLY